MSSTKNIVIIGAASAGAVLARALSKKLPESYRIILIDAKDHAYWQIGSLRAVVVPGFEDKIVHDLDNFWVKGSRHQIKVLTKVEELGEDYLVTDKGERIEFEYAVIATGATYASPGRSTSPLKNEVLASLRQTQKDYASAQNILIVGAGPTGVEIAGELVARYGVGKKNITIVGAGSQLIGKQYSPALHKKLLAQLEKAKVKVILNDQVDLPEGTSTGPLSSPQSFSTKSGQTIENVDYVQLSFFGKANSSIVASADASAVDEAGFVKTDPATFRVQSSKLTRHFALGDVSNLVPGLTQAQAANAQAPTLAANIVALAKADVAGKDAKSAVLKPYKPLPTLIVVPFGPSGGASQLPFGTFGEWVTGLIKGKSLFISTFDGFYKTA